jgi:hypothetical protein
MNATSFVAFQTKDSESIGTVVCTLPSCLNFMPVFECIKTHILSVEKTANLIML